MDASGAGTSVSTAVDGSCSQEKRHRAFEQPSVRVRRSRSLILVLESAGLVVLNFLNRQCVDCSDTQLRLLAAAEDWQTADMLLAQTQGTASEGVAELTALIENGFLLVEGTAAARSDERYVELWDWDVRAGLYHFSIKDADWMSNSEHMSELAERVETRERVPDATTNEDYETVIPLQAPELETGVFATLAKRRTYRLFSEQSAELDAVRDCLFAGLAIIGFIEEPVKGMGRRPLKMTPSGGARNPFEAYVYARNVAGLAPGFYHYSALENSLGLAVSAPLPAPRELLGGQEWTDAAAAIVFLVAHFPRTMWKYSHPNAYRALYLEAGHIGQNIMIAATARGLTAAPTAAVCDSTLESILSLDRITQGVLYSLVLGEPQAGALPGVGG
jgi:SagB-type dehydrogenase family enzyme